MAWKDVGGRSSHPNAVFLVKGIGEGGGGEMDVDGFGRICLFVNEADSSAASAAWKCFRLHPFFEGAHFDSAWCYLSEVDVYAVVFSMIDGIGNKFWIVNVFCKNHKVGCACIDKVADKIIAQGDRRMLNFTFRQGYFDWAWGVFAKWDAAFCFNGAWFTKVFDNASKAVTAHGGFAAILVENAHFYVSYVWFLEKKNAVSANA